MVITLWENREIPWRWIAIRWGLRRSNLHLPYPWIRNTSNNCEKSLMIGIWKLYMQVVFHGF